MKTKKTKKQKSEFKYVNIPRIIAITETSKGVLFSTKNFEFWFNKKFVWTNDVALNCSLSISDSIEYEVEIKEDIDDLGLEVGEYDFDSDELIELISYFYPKINKKESVKKSKKSNVEEIEKDLEEDD